MNITNLIHELEAVRDRYGDLCVYAYGDGRQMYQELWVLPTENGGNILLIDDGHWPGNPCQHIERYV